MSASPTISAISYEGLKAVTADGRPARLAIIDDDGKVIAAGQEVAEAAWAASIEAYRQFLKGEGHMRVFTSPKGA